MAIEMTFNALRVSRLFLASTTTKHTGYRVAQHLGINPPRAYEVLARLQHAGWLASQREQESRHRRLYELTEEGLNAARRTLAELQLTPMS
jgi:DNA-binding PadR family transcriptional regulator